jgi:hypothetical protein
MEAANTFLFNSYIISRFTVDERPWFGLILILRVRIVAYFSSFSRSTPCYINGFPSPVTEFPAVSPNNSLFSFFLVILEKLMQKQYLKISSQQVIPFEAG